MKEKNYKGDVLAFPESSELMFDDRIVALAALILGTDKPVYFGDSSGFNIGTAGAAGFHKDNPDKFNGALPDWQTEYTIIRMGIYCQSHVNYSAFLALRDKSHNTASSEKENPFLLTTIQVICSSGRCVQAIPAIQCDCVLLPIFFCTQDGTISFPNSCIRPRKKSG